jgi:hypothetical protein
MANSDAELNIRINTIADAKGAVDAKKGIAEITKEAEKLGGGKSGGGGGVLGALTSGFGAVAVAVGGLTVAIAAGKKAIAEYAEAEAGAFKLDSALQRQGVVLEGIRQKYQEIAGERQKATAISDDEYIRTLTRLTQFGVRPDQMEGVLKTVEDLAGLMDSDLGAATDAVTRALQGQWTAFTRLGIVIPENATQLEKWAAMAKQAADIGGGQLGAAAGGVDGQFKKLTNSVNDTFEAFGRLIAVSGLLKPLDNFRRSLDGISDAIGGVIPQSRDMETRFVRTQETLAASAEAAGKYAKALKAISEESEKASKSHIAELRALDDLKAAEEQRAKAFFDRDRAIVKQWEKGKTVSPERAAELTESIDRAEKQDSFQREQRFAQAGMKKRADLISGEDAKVKRAEEEFAKAQAALDEEKRRQKVFETVVKPLQDEIATLEKTRKEWMDNPGASEWLARKISPEFQALEAEIALKKSQGEKFAAEYSEANPGKLASAEQNFAAARSNLETVRKTSGEKKLELQEGLGRERLHFDNLEGTRRTERQTEGVERFGSGAAGIKASTDVLSTSARETIDAFQQFSQMAVGNQREMREVFLRELQNLRREHAELNNRVRNMRNH